eukprot:scaffold6149_cov90-Skeletonema_dohrnii-CCMP3373.AAC.6
MDVLIRSSQQGHWSSTFESSRGIVEETGNEGNSSLSSSRFWVLGKNDDCAEFFGSIVLALK